MSQGNGKNGNARLNIVLVTVINMLIAAMVGYLLHDFREFKREMRVSIHELEERNRAQDDLASAIRVTGFERLGRVEALLEEYDKRLQAVEGMRMRGSQPLKPGG